MALVLGSLEVAERRAKEAGYTILDATRPIQVVYGEISGQSQRTGLP